MDSMARMGAAGDAGTSSGRVNSTLAWAVGDTGTSLMGTLGGAAGTVVGAAAGGTSTGTLTATGTLGGAAGGLTSDTGLGSHGTSTGTLAAADTLGGAAGGLTSDTGLARIAVDGGKGARPGGGTSGCRCAGSKANRSFHS